MDQLQKLAQQELQKSKRKQEQKRQYQLDVSNAVLPDLMAEIAKFGEVRSFTIEPLDMPKKTITRKSRNLLE